MNGGCAFAVDPFAVDGIEGPRAIEGESSGRADASFGDGDGIEGLDGVEANIDEVRGQLRRGHGESLTEGRNKAAMISVVGVGYRSRLVSSTAARKRRGPPLGMTVVEIRR